MNTSSLEIYPLSQNGQIPNNPRLPLLLYRQVFTSSENLKDRFKSTFEQNRWGGTWTNGVYDYHHYHSNAHELLGVYSGTATLVFGGPGGRKVEVSSGDLVVIPAGGGHCCHWASDDFKVLGGYPHGQEDYDICTEKDDPEEKKRNIEKVPLPIADPLDGKGGRLMQEWR